MTLPLALTPGEPAGIGPDIALMLAARPRSARWVVIGDPQLLEARARTLALPVAVQAWQPGAPVPTAAGLLPVLPLALPRRTRAGEPDPANAPGLLAALNRAVDGCTSGEFSGIVTGPLNKAVINEAGIAFTGHTEYLAACTGGTPVMMLLAGELRVALATTHLPLRAVADMITAERIEAVVAVLDRDLRRRFGIDRPRIAVLGLNPHAGENGFLGREDIDCIGPAIERCRGAGIAVTGPLAADTAFTPAALARCDAVLAMYHDQGLPVLKYAGFGQAVNCTLGLPIIRTSVDHGTALDQAGTGRADPGSLASAIDLAALLAANSS